MVDRTRMRESMLSGRAVLWSGLVAGVLADLLLMTLMPLAYGTDPSGLVRMIGAIALGPEALRGGQDAGILVAALVVHFGLSFGYAALLGLAVHHVEKPTAWFLGGVFGFSLYFVNLYGFSFWFPWFTLLRNEVSFFTHVLFGLSLAAVYKRAQRSH